MTCLQFKAKYLGLCAFLLLAGCAPFEGSLNDETASTENNLKYELSNCCSEITVLQRRLNLLETELDALHEEIASTSKTNSNVVKDRTNSIHNKVTSLETTTQKLINDINTVKNHGNEVSVAMQQCQKQIQKLEETNASHTGNIHNLDVAMRSLMDAVQYGMGNNTKAMASLNKTSSGSVYKVKSGDTLEKIARNHHTTIEALKELNQLRSEDFIIAGQELALP